MSDDETQVRAIEYATPLPVRQSGLGIASFVVAIAAIATLGAVFAKINGRPASDPLAYKLLGLALILPVSGTVLGIASLRQRRRHRGLAVVGLILSVLLSLIELLAIASGTVLA